MKRQRILNRAVEILMGRGYDESSATDLVNNRVPVEGQITLDALVVA